MANSNQIIIKSSASPIFVEFNFHLRLTSLFLLFLFGIAQCYPAADSMGGQGVYLLKKSDAPQWEDLGWAWGKKRAAPAPASPQWDDLGWSWGKRSGAQNVGQEVAAEDLIEKASEQMKQRNVRAQQPSAFKAMNNRVMRSPSVAKNPDWHDLGWAWGRRK